jgi:hypothetical protein
MIAWVWQCLLAGAEDGEVVILEGWQREPVNFMSRLDCGFFQEGVNGT